MQPTLASQNPVFSQDTDSWISQIPPEDSSRLHETPVSNHFPSLNWLRPLYCGHLRSNSSSPVNTTAILSATEVDHNGRATEVDLSTGTTRGQHINTGFVDQSILPKADSKSDATALLQEVMSKITLLPVAFDRVPQQNFASSDSLHPDYSSETYVAPLDPSTSQEHTKDVIGTETGKGNFSQKGTTSDRHSGTEPSVVTGGIIRTTRHSSSEVPTHDTKALSRTLAETASSQTSSQMIGPTPATTTSTREWHDPAISGSNLSVGLSKQGVVLVLSSVLGGILALIGILVIHRFILLHFNRHAVGSVIVHSQPAADFPEKEERALPRTAEFSHFSIDT